MTPGERHLQTLEWRSVNGEWDAYTCALNLAPSEENEVEMKFHALRNAKAKRVSRLLSRADMRNLKERFEFPSAPPEHQLFAYPPGSGQRSMSKSIANHRTCQYPDPQGPVTNLFVGDRYIPASGAAASEQWNSGRRLC
ncbi:unnamed protein product [Amoebophrya sp. A25]|nr:unnamed protein product [Amoebophrya sp. A25]|eukprot:GSA25T00017628001.1